MLVGTVEQPRRKGPWQARSDPRRVLRIRTTSGAGGDGAGNLKAARRHRFRRADLREKVFVEGGEQNSVEELWRQRAVSAEQARCLAYP